MGLVWLERSVRTGRPMEKGNAEEDMLVESLPGVPRKTSWARGENAHVREQ